MTYENDILERLAADVANLWRRQRLDRRVVDAMDPVLVRKLDELDGLTLGDARRCGCLAARDSAGTRHDLQCPAYRAGPL